MSRCISTVAKETLKVISLLAFILALRDPTLLSELCRPVSQYVTNLYPGSTHQEIVTPDSKQVIEPLFPQPGRQSGLSLTESINQHFATPTVPSTSTKLENSESSKNHNDSEAQAQSADHLHFALKINQEEFAKRFHAGIVVPTETVEITSIDPTALTWNECEERMARLTAMHQADQWVEGMTYATKFLRDLNCTPSAYPEYRVLSAALAFQMAVCAGDSERAKYFGELAMHESRKFDNYKLEEIEASYYKVVGHQVDFKELFVAMDSLTRDFAGLPPEEAVKRSEALVAACGSLPATSIFRLRADLFEAIAWQTLDDDLFNDLRRFGTIQSNAQSAGNQVIENACEPIVTALLENLKGVVDTISEEIHAK